MSNGRPQVGIHGSPLSRRLVLASLVAAPVAGIAASAAPAATPDPPGGSEPWGYQGATGPENWGRLGDPTCASGREQSPIDLVEAKRVRVKDPSLRLEAGPVRVRPAPFSVVAEPAGGTQRLTTAEGTHRLLQMHYHAPAEHQVDGLLHPVEAHFVFQHPGSSTLAVLGVLIRGGGRTNQDWQPYVSAVARVGTDGPPVRAHLNWSRLLPRRRSSWRYPGSLTTPPCTEGVAWTVLQRPVVLSNAQVATLTQVWNGTNRPVQPVNERVLLVDR